MVSYTSIQILPETREELSHLKSSPRETYDELIKKLIELIPEGDEEGTYKDEFKVGLLNAKLDAIKGRTYSLSDVKKSLGLNK
ncbi:MAG: hypothetical protein J4432_03965 [DPANN group archaeon]|nr:hypothetical protein [DPANN group archaeon]